MSDQQNETPTLPVTCPAIELHGEGDWWRGFDFAKELILENLCPGHPFASFEFWVGFGEARKEIGHALQGDRDIGFFEAVAEKMSGDTPPPGVTAERWASLSPEARKAFVESLSLEDEAEWLKNRLLGENAELAANAAG